MDLDVPIHIEVTAYCTPCDEFNTEGGGDIPAFIEDHRSCADG